MQLEDNPGYILRVSSDEWVDQIFQLKKYYSGIMRNWRRGTPILFARKTEAGDSFLGYGVTDKVEMLWEMTPEEEDYCRENKWKCALTFQPLVKFQRPLPIRETLLAGDKRKGSFLHGAMLPEEQVDSILEQAEELQ
ncbi:hypothetical protein A3K69_00170 [Candidatus Bathyarchaeota archaeon RBG_16_57_9]|nr:MAG: hypothetical protein A3K69_00170 [Candidatus Bathyarchaeota archaeon RBG_16_57_9]